MKPFLVSLLVSLCGFEFGKSFSLASTSSVPRSAPQPHQPVGNILILDHLNFNHEKGRHDWLKAFYFDFLNCAVDPRKAENLKTGKNTLWANIGSQQFHLPEGKPDAQVLEGVVTLVYPDLNDLQDRYKAVQESLKGSKFSVAQTSKGVLDVIDPWGSHFHIVSGDEKDRDERGMQPGDVSEGLSMRDLTIYTPEGCSMAGISRFYERILGAPILERSNKRCVVSVGPQQTLTFVQHPEKKKIVSHDEMRDDGEIVSQGTPHFLSNYGPHISMYVTNLRGAYEQANELGVCYVNPRFKRRAYNLEEALDDCMFRCINIVDPDNVQAGPILKLEHEIRSVVKKDGSKYKSCPFDEIPKECCV